MPMMEPTVQVEVLDDEAVTKNDDDDDDDDQDDDPSTSNIKECTGCGKTFKKPACYYAHIQSCIFKGVPNDVVSEPPLANGRQPCPGCKREFKCINLPFVKHVSSCHKVKIGGYPCHVCGTALSTRTGYKRHMATKCQFGVEKQRRAAVFGKKARNNAEIVVEKVVIAPKVNSSTQC